MVRLVGWCPNGHEIEIYISGEDVRREGEEGVVAVTGVEDVRCEICGKLLEDLES